LGHFLLTTVGTPRSIGWLLWLEGERPWSEAEAAALTLAGQVLSRWLVDDEAPHWAEQLDRADRQQRLETTVRVARRLAHDFGNVLTGILGFAELALAQHVPTHTPLHSYLTEVVHTAQGGARLTGLLRQFSRGPSATSHATVLAPVLAAEKARLGNTEGVLLDVNLPADLPAVALDAEHIAQVLAALLDNAREALDGPGRITVSGQVRELSPADCRDLFGDPRPGPHVEVHIADTGTGLRPDVARRLFAEPFFSTKPRHRGFGLTLTYGILAANRGGLRLEPGPEGGARARIVLPVATARVAGPAAPAPRQETPCGERILAVDDDPVVLQLVTRTLERAGYRVEGVGSTQAALAACLSAATDPFRLVLTDVMMPSGNGVDLARRLVSHDASVRVLLMSGQISADYAQQDLATSHFDLLPKPFRADGLLRAVRRALERTPVRQPQGWSG
jgi:signal transduction histidine kinase/CheY-like chemotaxis protein